MTPPALVQDKPVSIFISYAHENASWFGRLRPLLKFRSPSFNLAYIWHDQKLEAGDRWDVDIRAALETMDVFVCLVSYEFMYSDYIMDVELPMALEREKKNEVVIVPILLFPVDLEEDCPELHQFKRFPAWDKCWSAFEQSSGHYQNAHKPIREGLREAIEKVKAKR